MTWTPSPFWPGCGATVEGGCADCTAELEDEEEYWENLSEDEWEDYAHAAKKAYRNDAFPERKCDCCGQPYRGPAVYCSLDCAINDA